MNLRHRFILCEHFIWHVPGQCHYVCIDQLVIFVKKPSLKRKRVVSENVKNKDLKTN